MSNRGILVSVAWQVVLTLVASALGAQSLVRDLRTSPKPAVPPPPVQTPVELTGFGGRVFFASEVNGFRLALWATDGTPEGAEMVCEDVAAFQLTKTERGLFFTADALWITDGTAAGTVLLRTFPDPSGRPTRPWQLTAYRGGLLFVANQKLWKSDGTAAGTVEVAPGATFTSPAQPTTAGRLVFFYASTAAEGRELWVTDGTAAGTHLVADIAPGPASSNPALLGIVDGELYLAANDGVSGVELWRSDGTAEGTNLVVDLATGAAGSNPSNLIAFGGQACFEASGTAGTGLYATDGMAGGTRLLATVNVISSVTWSGRLWFSTQDSLWATDGTPAGTQQVSVISGASWVTELTVVGNRLFFAVDGYSTSQLWISDGTPSGTVEVFAFLPSSWGARPSDIEGVGGTALFTAADSRGRMLWRSDGTTSGTVAMPLPDLELISSDPAPTASLDGIMLGAADGDATGAELWRSDGSSAGTTLVADIYPGPRGSVPDISGAWQGFALFAANDGIWGNELWRTDGTSAGTRMVVDLWSGSGPSDPRELVQLNGQWYFAADSDVYGWELFTTDGTPQGTRLVVDLEPGPLDAYVQSLTRFRDEIYFSAMALGAGSELHATDGTAAGTRLVADVWPGSRGSGPRDLTAVGNRLFFAAEIWDDGQLWVTDGTAASTIALTAGVRFRLPTLWGGVGDLLIFTQYDPTLGTELWVSDGTVAGTGLLLDLWPGPASSSPELRAVLDDSVLFVASHPEHGDELWRSDGTSAGTRLLIDIAPDHQSGVRRSGRAARVGLGPQVLFGAGAGVGEELWVTDGTRAGTRLLAELAAGGRSSAPGPFMTAGDRVYFGAVDAALGRELFSMPLSVIGAAHAEVLGVGCGSAGRPELDAIGLPNIGNPEFALGLSSAPPLAPGALLVTGQGAVPGACTLIVTAPVLALPVQTDPTGQATVPLPIPRIPSLIGASLYSQAVVADSAGPLAGIASVTQALQLVLGGQRN